MNTTLKPTTPTSDKEEPSIRTNFAESKIYKIYSDNLPDTCYIGSTVRTLERRLSKHVHDAKKQHVASYQIIDAGAYHIELVEAFPCTSAVELRKREQHHMGMNVCCNKQRAFRTDEERIEQKRVRNAKHNTTKIQCFCGGRYTWHHKA